MQSLGVRTHPCAYCGEEMTERVSKPRKYCGPECERLSRITHRPQPCPICGTTMVKPPHQVARQYCSPQCAGVAKARAVTKPCLQCGAAVTRSPSRVMNKTFCNDTCYRAWQHRPLHDRAWSRVEKTDGCWIWMGDHARHGYGCLDTREIGGTRRTFAHRYFYELEHGPGSANGWNVCHHCDNPSCVRPDHLFLGSHADNVADKVTKGRHRRGTQHPLAILTEDDVRLIRATARAPGMARDLAQRFGVSESLIYRIRRRRLWKDV